VWKRREDEQGGMVLGSAGAFLVLEAREHAEARGAKGYAAITGVASDHSRRAAGDGADTMRRLFDELGCADSGPLPVISGACGVTPVLNEELAFLDTVAKTGRLPVTRAYGSLFGHTVEAHFPLGVALAALALKLGSLPAPFDDTGAEAPLGDTRPREVLVTGMGHWRGEGLALVKAVN
jgi:3-oxoacyl-[acyl-carrier-protein] synthase II